MSIPLKTLAFIRAIHDLFSFWAAAASQGMGIMGLLKSFGFV